MGSLESRIEEVNRMSHDDIAALLTRFGVAVKRDKALKHNVGWLARVAHYRGDYWTIARNVYRKMVEDGTI